MDYIEVYKREQVQHDAADIAAFAVPDKINAITVHSGESLQTLADLLSTARKSIRAIPIVVPSARVAKQAERSGFKQVVNAHGADDASMIKALERIHPDAD